MWPLIPVTLGSDCYHRVGPEIHEPAVQVVGAVHIQASYVVSKYNIGIVFFVAISIKL